MTVYENLAFPLRVRKIPKDEADKKIDKALSMVSLQGFAQRMPGQLSGGQQQRVAVARSLVFDPQLVLMDEPLGALDKNLRESMQYEIKHIHESIGVTVVYVTHDQSEALTMSNRIAVFNDGKVQQLSSPDELYEKPVNSFVAEFIGENNTFAGEVSEISSGKCKVKLANAEIMANPISVKGKGEKTTVSLRPERALINPNDKMDNIHKGKIEEIIKNNNDLKIKEVIVFLDKSDVSDDERYLNKPIFFKDTKGKFINQRKEDFLGDLKELSFWRFYTKQTISGNIIKLGTDQIENFFSKKIPLCGVLGGGYNKSFDKLIELHSMLHKNCAKII